MELLHGWEILLGTYEAFVMGYKLRPDLTALDASFADHAHSATVRCIAAADKFFISSGDDENVKVFNLRKRTEHGQLTHSDTAVNAMVFYDRKHLVTGAEDGNIAIVKAGSWTVQKVLLKHQAGIVDIAIHPSGKMALSVAKDKKMVTWNLIKGRSAYVTNLKEVASFVRWSPCGKYYLVGFYRRLDVYSVASASVMFSLALPGRTNDVVFLDETLFALAGDMPQVQFYSLATKALVSQFEAHETRVRCLALLGADAGAGNQLLITSSNDGWLKVWSLQKTGQEVAAKLEVSVDTKCRISCMLIHRVPDATSTEEATKE